MSGIQPVYRRGIDIHIVDGAPLFMLAQSDAVLFDVIQQLLIGPFPRRSVLLAAVIHRPSQVSILADGSASA